jgi:hypothetical protein
MKLIWKLGGKLHLPSDIRGIALCGTEGLYEEEWQDNPECLVCIAKKEAP